MKSLTRLLLFLWLLSACDTTVVPKCATFEAPQQLVIVNDAQLSDDTIQYLYDRVADEFANADSAMLVLRISHNNLSLNADGGSLGYAWCDLNYAEVYLDVVRHWCDTDQLLCNVVLHEVGHLYGLNHDDGGCMISGVPVPLNCTFECAIK